MPKLTITSLYVDGDNEWHENVDEYEGRSFAEVQQMFREDMEHTATTAFRTVAYALWAERSVTKLGGEVMPFSFSVSNGQKPCETQYGDRMVFAYTDEPRDGFTVTWGQGGYDHTAHTDAKGSALHMGEALSRNGSDDDVVMITNMATGGQRRYKSGAPQWTDLTF